jgi:DNA-binding transcriptional ArsR family regulator
MAKHVLVDSRLVKAHQNPIRIEILTILYEGPTSPARICRRLDNVSLNLVSHHIKVLMDLDCIELVETTEKRGANEHIYRATLHRVIDDDTWERLDPKIRQPLTATLLQMISADVSRALAQGDLDQQSDTHITRMPLKLDGQGWEEAVKIVGKAVYEILEIAGKAAERLTGDEEAIEARAAFLLFPTTNPEG